MRPIKEEEQKSTPTAHGTHVLTIRVWVILIEADHH